MLEKLKSFRNLGLALTSFACFASCASRPSILDRDKIRTGSSDSNFDLRRASIGGSVNREGKSPIFQNGDYSDFQLAGRVTIKKIEKF